MFKKIVEFLIWVLYFGIAAETFVGISVGYGAVPYIFATQPKGPVPASYIDADFVAVDTGGTVTGVTCVGVSAVCSSGGTSQVPAITITADPQGAAAAAIAGQMPGNAATASNVPYSGLTGSVPTWNQNTTGTAAAASALAATPANCGTGNYATGINAAGSAVGCASAAGAYQLPVATSTVLGGTKPDGTTITNNAGAISVTYGTTAGTAAQGNDSRIAGAVQSGGALGTPSSGTATNLTGTASGLTSGNTSNVSGQTAAAVAAATTMVQAATSANTPNTLAERDASGVIGASAFIPVLTYTATSGVAVNGASYLVSTSGVPAVNAVQLTLPASAPNATASFTDVYGTFNTSPLVIYSATDPINGVAGPVTLTWTTRWLKGVCQYTNIAAFGWLCR